MIGVRSGCMANTSHSYCIYDGGTPTSGYFWFVWERTQSGTDVRRDELNCLLVLSFRKAALN